MSGKLYAPNLSTSLTGDPSNPANAYGDITGTALAGSKRALDVNALSADYKIVTDSTSTAGTTYVGYAAISSATSSAVWKLFKVVISSGNCTVTWADGDAEFDNIWDNRTGLSYS